MQAPVVAAVRPSEPLGTLASVASEHDRGATAGITVKTKLLLIGETPRELCEPLPIRISPAENRDRVVLGLSVHLRYRERWLDVQTTCDVPCASRTACVSTQGHEADRARLLDLNSLCAWAATCGVCSKACRVQGQQRQRRRCHCRCACPGRRSNNRHCNTSHDEQHNCKGDHRINNCPKLKA